MSRSTRKAAYKPHPFVKQNSFFKLLVNVTVPSADFFIILHITFKLVNAYSSLARITNTVNYEFSLSPKPRNKTVQQGNKSQKKPLQKTTT